MASIRGLAGRTGGATGDWLIDPEEQASTITPAQVTPEQKETWARALKGNVGMSETPTTPPATTTPPAAPPAATAPAATPPPAPSIKNSGRGSDIVQTPEGYVPDTYRVDANGVPSWQKMPTTSPAGSMRNIATPKTQAELFADVSGGGSAPGLIAAFNAAGALSANERAGAEFQQSENAARVAESRAALEAELGRGAAKRAEELQPLSMRALGAKTQHEEIVGRGAALQQSLTEKVLAGGEEGKKAAATLQALRGKPEKSDAPSPDAMLKSLDDQIKEMRLFASGKNATPEQKAALANLEKQRTALALKP